MGDGGKDWSNQSTPAHEMHLDAYYIGKHPVTNADYQRYMKTRTDL
jgi:formylglycine-generating enzyme required for sulfatase activity